jgi:curved DNA-binding protein CbpA
MIENLYRMLNLSGRATPDEIHRAYRMLAMRYHPDRNPSAGSATLMAAINRAYEVLSEPDSRAAYDKTQTPREATIDDTVLDAARDMLLKRSWVVVQEGREDLVLRNGSRCAHISLAGQLDAALFNRFHQRSMGFCAVLAVRVEPPVPVPPKSAVVLDLMHSRIYGGDFPDPTYQELFKPFLA